MSSPLVNAKDTILLVGTRQAGWDRDAIWEEHNTGKRVLGYPIRKSKNKEKSRGGAFVRISVGLLN